MKTKTIISLIAGTVPVAIGLYTWYENTPGRKDEKRLNEIHKTVMSWKKVKG